MALLALVLFYLGAVLWGPVAALGIQLVEVGADAVLSALGSPEAIAALVMTGKLTLIAVACNAVFGVGGAIVLVRHRFLGRGLVDALADLPLAVSPVMVGLAFLLLFGREGWLQPLLSALNTKVLFAFPGLVLATLFVTLPYTIREVAYVLEELGTSEEEAAATLGASSWQIFWRVTLPNVRYGLGYGLLMTTARSLGEFGAVLVLGGSISRQTQTATTFVHDALEEREFSGAYGMAALLALISIGLLFALEWARRRRERER